jgi:tRNA(fMet)-specific endonuclease VapC
MNGSAIDTNVIIRMLNNDEAAIDVLNKTSGAFVPIIVVGELFYGANNSTRKQENIELFRKVLNSFDGILPVNETVAESYATIKFDLKKNGFTIPENDVWIAAIAHAYDLSLATFDKHFQNIPYINTNVIP